ncbi:MAG: hypothetical protein WCK98_04435 [bacterium]
MNSKIITIVLISINILSTFTLAGAIVYKTDLIKSDNKSQSVAQSDSQSTNNSSSKRNRLPLPDLSFLDGQVDPYTLSSANSTNSNSSCIVTISGNTYDVTSLRKTHSGGDIFACATDMTGTYQGKHGTNLGLIQRYLTTASGASGSVSAAQSPANPGGCIVTISGNTYDVTSLRNTHSGGNIFACGTDMTGTYQGKHGSNLALIQRYLVSGSNPGTANPGNGGGTENDSEDEREGQNKVPELKKPESKKNNKIENNDKGEKDND